MKSHGLTRNDFGAIEKAAGRIGYSDRMGAMCSHMGAVAPGFNDQATAFHKTADTIAEAARSKDPRRCRRSPRRDARDLYRMPCDLEAADRGRDEMGPGRCHRGWRPSRRITLRAQHHHLDLFAANLANAYHALRTEHDEEHWRTIMDYVRLGLGDSVDSVNTSQCFSLDLSGLVVRLLLSQSTA
jgi:hypothetical protein